MQTWMLKKEEEVELKVRQNEDVRKKVRITEQVLASMAAGRMKKDPKSKEAAKPAMTPF